MTVKEQKTGKLHNIKLTREQMVHARALCGRKFVFPNARSQDRHRCRTTVYAALKRQAQRVYGKDHTDGVSPHSLRKAYAVELMRRTGDLEAVQRVLGHKYISTTALYAFSDRIKPTTSIQQGKKGKR